MKKILVALDGSSRSEEVLASAISLAKATGAKIILFRSFGLSQALPRHAMAFPDDAIDEILRKEAQEYLDACAKTVPKELFAGTRVALGTPWQAICAAARDEQVDLVVIGSHGYSGLDYVLGTTAARVVNHIDRPVLVVRRPPPQAPARG